MGNTILKPSTKMCYTILPTQYEEGKGYIPSLVIDGEHGHRPLTGQGEFAEPWYWGPTLEDAERIAAQKNAEMGISPKEAMQMVLRSMR